jgi:hypothetical protein
MRAKPMIWAAVVAVALGSTSLSANVVVVKSLGPSAKAYPPGKMLPTSAKIALQGGDVVTVLGPSAAETFRGPGNFDAAQASLVSASSQRGRFGALRSAKVGHSPSIWDIDVTQSGKVCVLATKKLQLWRPDTDAAASIEIHSSDGAMQKLSWASGEALATWPTAVPLKNGGKYEIEWSERQDKSSLEVTTVDSVKPDQIATAQVLIQNGCQNQLDLLVAGADRAPAR